MQDVSLILDIGKTNKKLILFDRTLEIVHESSVSIPELEGRDGLVYDDVEQMLAWLEHSFRQIGQAKKYSVRAINVTTFGATVVHLDARGETATPVYSYLSEVSESVHRQFLDRFSALPGGFARLATPPLGKFLNVAKQLFWLDTQHRKLAGGIAHTLFLPQFFVYRLTGKIFSEATSLGCHTGLWDFEAGQPSQAALSALHWQKKLPKIVSGDPFFTLEPAFRDMLGATDEVIVGSGLHDSSSALAPFSKTLRENFVLVSTGTWIIAQNPGANFQLSAQDLAEDRLYYLTPQQKPVRAARLFAGREHELQLQRIADFFGKMPDQSITSSPQQLEASFFGFFAESGERSLLPEALHGSGPFPRCHTGNWDLSQFESAEEAYARLCLDLAVLASYCIDSVASEETTGIVVDGGFARNAWFVHLLAMLQAPKKVMLTEVAQATAMGAALMLHERWAGPDSLSFELDLRPVMAKPVSGLRVYAERFLANLQD